MPTHRTKLPLASALLLATLARSVSAQAGPYGDSLSLFRYTQPVRMTLLLPVDGPAASVLNPARLADGEKLYAQIGTRKSGDSRGLDLSLGGGFFQRFYLGAFASGASGTFSGTNAVILDNRFGIQAAYRWSLDAEGRGHLSIGLTGAFRQVNMMGRFKSIGYTPDMGIVLVPSSYPGGWKLEFGWAVRDLLGFDATAPRPVSDYRDPDQYRHVDFAPWLSTASVIASSPAGRWSLFSEAAAGAIYEPAYRDKELSGLDAGMMRLYLPRIGARYRPVEPLSITLERVWSRYWAASASVGTGSWLPVRLEADLRSAYGPYLQYLYPDRTGWSLGWNLRLVW
jgi:hypothetical protein